MKKHRGWYKQKKPGGGFYPAWRRRYLDENGDRRQFTGYTDITMSERAFQNRMLEVSAAKHRKEMGYADLDNRDIQIIIREYLAYGKREGGRGGHPWSTGYTINMARDLVRIAKRMGVSRLIEVKRANFEDALSDLFPSEPGTRRTSGGYFKSFMNWCHIREKIHRNPLLGWPGKKLEGTRRRRALSPEAIQAMLRVAPKHKAIAVEVALCTGARSKEMNHFHTESMRHDTHQLFLPGMIGKTRVTKNGKDHLFDIPEALWPRLVEHARHRMPGTKLFDLAKNKKAKMIRKWLSLAGIPYETEEGYVDFHAMRTAFQTFLGQSADSTRTLTEVGRTTDLRMNTEVYQRTDALRKKSAVEGVYNLVNHKKAETKTPDVASA